jgi:hypothetical protein
MDEVDPRLPTAGTRGSQWWLYMVTRGKAFSEPPKEEIMLIA